VDVSEHSSIFIGGVSILPACTAYEVGTGCSETSTQNSVAGESPKRKNTIISGVFAQRYPVSYSD